MLCAIFILFQPVVVELLEVCVWRWEEGDEISIDDFGDLRRESRGMGGKGVFQPNELLMSYWVRW